MFLLWGFVILAFRIIVAYVLMDSERGLFAEIVGCVTVYIFIAVLGLELVFKSLLV